MSAESPRSEADTPPRGVYFPLTDGELARRQAVCAMAGGEYVAETPDSWAHVITRSERVARRLWDVRRVQRVLPDRYRWGGDPLHDYFRAGDTAAEQAAFDRMMAAAITEETGHE